MVRTKKNVALNLLSRNCIDGWPLPAKASMTGPSLTLPPHPAQPFSSFPLHARSCAVSPSLSAEPNGAREQRKRIGDNKPWPPSAAYFPHCFHPPTVTDRMCPWHVSEVQQRAHVVAYPEQVWTSMELAENTNGKDVNRDTGVLAAFE